MTLYPVENLTLIDDGKIIHKGKFVWISYWQTGGGVLSREDFRSDLSFIRVLLAVTHRRSEKRKLRAASQCR